MVVDVVVVGLSQTGGAVPLQREGWLSARVVLAVGTQVIGWWVNGRMNGQEMGITATAHQSPPVARSVEKKTRERVNGFWKEQRGGGGDCGCGAGLEVVRQMDKGLPTETHGALRSFARLKKT